MKNQYQNGTGFSRSTETEPRTATLAIVQTSDTCISYRLQDATGRVVWSNRVSPVPAGHEGARKHIAGWALANGYRIVQRKGGEAEPAVRMRKLSA